MYRPVYNERSIVEFHQSGKVVPLEKTDNFSVTLRDGFLRIALSDLLSINLIHLVSGLDDDDPLASHRCGSVTSIMGYTEWVGGKQEESISLGWDWHMEQDVCGEVTCARVGFPRSNIMLVDSENRDYGWDRNLEILATVVDAIPWTYKTQIALQHL